MRLLEFDNAENENDSEGEEWNEPEPPKVLYVDHEGGSLAIRLEDRSVAEMSKEEREKLRRSPAPRPEDSEEEEDADDGPGRTALDVAMLIGSSSKVNEELSATTKALLGHIAEESLRSNSSEDATSALFGAAWFGHADVVSSLLRAGADWKLPTSRERCYHVVEACGDGQTAYDLAAQMKMQREQALAEFERQTTPQQRRRLSSERKALKDECQRYSAVIAVLKTWAE